MNVRESYSRALEQGILPTLNEIACLISGGLLDLLFIDPKNFLLKTAEVVQYTIRLADAEAVIMRRLTDPAICNYTMIYQ